MPMYDILLNGNATKSARSWKRRPHRLGPTSATSFDARRWKPQRQICWNAGFTIPAKDWERFETWAAKPARQIAGLRALARRHPTWRK
jgi:hypothetical protein